MKPVLVWIFEIVIVCHAPAITLESYNKLATAEKIKVLQGEPERVLNDTTKLLSLYTTALRDPSPELQKAAAQASAFLVMGLQSAKQAGRMPAFPEYESAAFQRALVDLLDH
jgi:hypothetical protein